MLNPSFLLSWGLLGLLSMPLISVPPVVVEMLRQILRVEVVGCLSVGCVPQEVVSDLFSVSEQHVDSVVVSQELHHLVGEGLSLLLIVVDPVVCIIYDDY